MRLVSQDRNRDLPYEDCVVFITNHDIFAHTGNQTYLLGKYDSEEEVEVVMQDLRAAYVLNYNYGVMNETQRAVMSMQFDKDEEQLSLYGVYCFPGKGQVLKNNHRGV